MTTNARPMPVDPAPVADGNVALEQRGGRVLAQVLGAARRFGRTDLRKSHFATCPQAAQWRKRGRP